MSEHIEQQRRDFFAARAMQSMLIGAHIPGLLSGDRESLEVVMAMSKAAYIIADAMIKAGDLSNV